MSEQNQTVARIFDMMANVLDIQGENTHRASAYRRAAESIRELEDSLEKYHHENNLTQIPHIGDILASKIGEYLQTGGISAYQRLLDQVPIGLLQILEIPGMGPRRTKLFWDMLGITSVDEMESAAIAGHLRQLKGIGARTEQKLLDGIRAWRRQRTGRIPLGVAWPLIQEIKLALREVPGVFHAESAGSLRRMRETVGDLDLLVATANPDSVVACFQSLPMVEEVIASGPVKTSIRTMDGIQVDLRVLPPGRWGTGLQFFTGSQAHNVRIRALAKERGFALSEYGFQCEGSADIICAGEEAVYKTLGLPWIPPELREDRGEVQAALEGRLPSLVTRSDLLGDFHCHSTYSGGAHSVMEMAQAAHQIGLQYLVIADHANGAANGRGLSLGDVDTFLDDIARVNAWFDGTFHVISGVEVNIKSDGALEWPDEALARLDFVVASIHTDFNLSKELMTKRVRTAMQNPFVDMIGHPTGRLLGRRERIALDMEAAFDAALRYGTAMEINAWPQRLDLNDVYIRQAVELGVPLAISSDSHDIEGFAVLDFGVAMARRGWAEPQHLLNTFSNNDVLTWRRERLHRRNS